MTELGSEERRTKVLCSALADDVIFYRDAKIVEWVNDLFEFDVVVTTKADFKDADKLLGSHVSVVSDLAAYFKDADFEPRVWDGIVTRCTFEGMGHDLLAYRLRLRPWLAVAAQRRNKRIFHEKTVVEIITEVFGDYTGTGSNLYLDKLSGTYPTLEYTVQYDESDLDFVKRLMERFGISYFFTHAEGSHTLILFDDNSVHEIAPCSPVPLIYQERGHFQHENFRGWSHERTMTTAAWRVVDYDFKNSKTLLDKEYEGSVTDNAPVVESFAYPGDFLTEAAGQPQAKLRTEASQGSELIYDGFGEAPSLAVGAAIVLDAEDRAENGEKFVCTRASHRLVSDHHRSADRTKLTDHGYDGIFEFVAFDTPIRPERATPRPVMRGPQTAVVVKGLECDEFGRIKVKFHWDVDKAHSMWCRVSQSWAGPKFGAFVLPRTGMEVIVEFLDGDPDKPIVTGCVYNDANEVPYELPKNATRSTFRTDTVDGTGSNELRFEDKKGAEEVFVHAQKDLNYRVREDWTEHTNKVKVESVGESKVSEIGDRYMQVVDNAMVLLVGESNRNLVTPEKADDQREGIGRVAADYTSDKAGDLKNGDLGIGVDATLYREVGKDVIEWVEQNVEQEVGGNVTSTITGNLTYDVGPNVEITATSSIKLKCGSSEIELTPAGITIKGVKIDLKSDAATAIKAGATLDVNAGALLTLKGAAVKLN